MNATTAQRDRFVAAYDDAYADILRFVRRRTTTGAEDVVAEAMTTAWRKVDLMPVTPDAARAWLFGIARRSLLNQYRTLRRRTALAVRLGDHVTTGYTPDSASEVATRIDLANAWQALSARDQETLALTALEHLTSEQAGAVLGITATAYRARLARARTALRSLLEEQHDTSPALTTCQEPS